VPFDLRTPIGWLFTVYGAILLGHGAWSGKGHAVISSGLNVNLLWGAVLLAFGLGLLIAVKLLKRRR